MFFQEMFHKYTKITQTDSLLSAPRNSRPNLEFRDIIDNHMIMYIVYCIHNMYIYVLQYVHIIQ